MPDFVSFETLFRPHPAIPRDAIADEPKAKVSEVQPYDDLDEALSDARRFRAALADVFDASLERLLEDVAAEVLARELRLAPADLRAVVQRVRERFAGEMPVRVRVHPSDAARVATLDVRVIEDATLRSGDAVIELRDATVDATLGARLERVLGR